jgi:hypothetical protein
LGVRWYITGNGQDILLRDGRRVLMLKSLCFALVVVVLTSTVGYAAGPEFSGMVQLQYVDEADENSNFLIKAARLGAKAELTGRISGEIQIDVSKEPAILDAIVYIDIVKYVNFTVGQFKIPFSYEAQLTRFDLEAIERSLAISGLMNNGVSSPYLRDVGAMLTGKFKVFDYELAVVNGTGYNYHAEDESTGVVFAKWSEDNNNTKDVVGRIRIGIPLLAGLGFSFYEGSWADDLEKAAKGFYLYLDTGKVIFQYEYVRGRGLLMGDEWTTSKYSGYYIVVGYRLTRFVEPVLKVDKLDPDRNVGGDKLTDTYYGLNLNVERKARFQVFYRDSKTGGIFTDKGWRAQVSARF